MLFKSFDGAEIYIHEWTDVEQPKGVVQIIHGMAEHAARYEPFARFLNEHGYIVVADDHRGHGRTDPDTLGYHAGDMYADTVRDEGLISDYYKAKYPGLKYFVFGFSYGSFLTQTYISLYGDKIDGAVIAGSTHKKDAEVYTGTVVAGIVCAFGGAKKGGKMLAKLSFGKFAKKFADRGWHSTNPESNKAYHKDPFCGFYCSYRFYKDFFRGLRRLYTKKYIKGLKKDLPVLLASGESDPVGNMGKGVNKLYNFYTKKAGMSNVSMVLFENSRHEFLNEVGGRDVKWSTPLEFFEKH